VKNKLSYGKVKNKSGDFVKADLASVTAAASGVKTIPDDFRISITDSPAKGAYPISTFTWLLLPSKFSDAAKGKAITGFLKWAITDGQNYVEALSYSKLPNAVVAKEQKTLASIH
jgi:phosphate transport system substrate-binding protein